MAISETPVPERETLIMKYAVEFAFAHAIDKWLVHDTEKGDHYWTHTLDNYDRCLRVEMKGVAYRHLTLLLGERPNAVAIYAMSYVLTLQPFQVDFFVYAYLCQRVNLAAYDYDSALAESLTLVSAVQEIPNVSLPILAIDDPTSR